MLSREAMSIDIAEPKLTCKFVYKRFDESESSEDQTDADPARYVELKIEPAQSAIAPSKTQPVNCVSEQDFFGSDFRGVSVTNFAAPAAFVALLSSSALLSDVKQTGSRSGLASSLDELTPNSVMTTAISAGMSVLIASDVVTDEQMKGASQASARLKISSKIIADVMRRVAHDPTSPAAASAEQLVQQAIVTQRAAVTDGWLQSDMSLSSGTFSQDGEAKIEAVGFLISRTPVSEERFVPISRGAVVRDVRVKYGQTYRYVVSVVCRVTAPAVSDSGVQGWLTFACKSSGAVAEVTCLDVSPPPPPADVSLTEMSQTRALLTWSFPVNSQRDIVAFQVYKRANLLQPFTLLMQLGDLPRGVTLRERAPRESALACMFEDHRYARGDIYAVASVDAHGMTSGYSAQLSNTVSRGAQITRRVVPQGCPKAYPNLYLETDLFPDVITHQNASKLRLHFTPDCLAVAVAGKKAPVVLPKQSAEYVLQVTSLSVQRAYNLRIKIDDRRTS